MRRSIPGKAMHWDDLTGEPLDPEEVQKARRLEVEYFRQMEYIKGTGE